MTAQMLAEVAAHRHDQVLTVAGLLPVLLLATILDAGLDRRLRELDRTGKIKDMVFVRAIWTITILLTVIVEALAIDGIGDLQVSSGYVLLLEIGAMLPTFLLICLLIRRVWAGAWSRLKEPVWEHLLPKRIHLVRRSPRAEAAE